MKKIFLYAFAVIAALGGLTACNDDEDQLTDTRLTYYPVITLEGDEFMQVPIGTNYVEPGYSAVLAGEDFTSSVVVEGASEVDKDQAGLYYITYTATNADGFSTSVTRTVAVCDPTITTDISGKYTTQPGTHRLRQGTEIPYPGYSVTITKAAPGIFHVSDILGGYYSQGAGYGNNYAMNGYFQLMADNTINVLSGNVPGWGDSYDDFIDGKYDPATGEVSYTCVYAGMDFVVILNK